LNGPDDSLAVTNANALSQSQSASMAVNAYMQNSINQTDTFMKGDLGAFNEMNDTAPHLVGQGSFAGDNDGLLPNQIESLSREQLEAMVAKDSAAGFHLDRVGITEDYTGMAAGMDFEFDVDGAFGGGVDAQAAAFVDAFASVSDLGSADDAKTLQAAINQFNGLEEGAKGALSVDGDFGKNSQKALKAALFSEKALNTFDWQRENNLQGYQNALYDLGGSNGKNDTMLLQAMLVSEDRNGALAGHMDKNSGVGKFGSVTAAAYNASRTNDPELAAIYSAQGLTNTGGDTRQLQVTRDGRTIDFNVRGDATNLAQSISGLSVNEALRKVNPDTYKALIGASFDTKGLTAVEINGGWRSKESIPNQSAQHPTGRGLDISSLSFGDNTIQMKVFDSKGNTDMTRSKAFDNYDSGVEKFSQNLLNQNKVNSVLNPWETYSSKKSKWLPNDATSTAERGHRDHLHFGVRY
jgi:hypothetical protein